MAITFTSFQKDHERTHVHFPYLYFIPQNNDVVSRLEVCREPHERLNADVWLFSYIEFSVEAMKFLIGKKMEMSQIFKEDGTVIPITYVQAGPCVVTDVRTKEKDGYHAVQVGFGTARRTSKAQSARAQLHGPVAITREYRTEDLGEVQTGDTLTVEQFVQGDLVDVVGTSKGRGFSGVVKRHGFAGQSATHGTKDQIRKSGSIGAGGVQRVFKGMRMAGRMGGDRVTVKNLEIVSVDPQTHRLAIRGAVPGARNSLVLIKGRGERLHWSV